MDTYIKILPSNGLVTNCGFSVTGEITPADLPFANALGYVLLKVGKTAAPTPPKLANALSFHQYRLHRSGVPMHRPPRIHNIDLVYDRFRTSLQKSDLNEAKSQ